MRSKEGGRSQIPGRGGKGRVQGRSHGGSGRWWTAARAGGRRDQEGTHGGCDLFPSGGSRRWREGKDRERNHGVGREAE